MVATPEEDATGLTQAIAGWEAALSALTDLQTSLHGRANPLGLDPGFLMLADRVTVDSVNHFDSFDSFAAQLDPDASTSPLAIALEDL